MKRKFIIAPLAALAILAASCSSEKEFSRLSGLDSVTEIHIPGAVTWATGLVSGEKSVRSTGALHVIVSENPANDSIVMSCVSQIIDNRKASELMNVVDGDEKVTIYGSPDEKHPDKIRRPLVVVRENDEIVVVSFSGALDLATIEAEARKHCPQ